MLSMVILYCYIFKIIQKIPDISVRDCHYSNTASAKIVAFLSRKGKAISIYYLYYLLYSAYLFIHCISYLLLLIPYHLHLTFLCLLLPADFRPSGRYLPRGHILCPQRWPKLLNFVLFSYLRP